VTESATDSDRSATGELRHVNASDRADFAVQGVAVHRVLDTRNSSD